MGARLKVCEVEGVKRVDGLEGAAAKNAKALLTIIDSAPVPAGMLLEDPLHVAQTSLHRVR
jgi:hypothetical protein